MAAASIPVETSLKTPDVMASEFGRDVLAGFADTPRTIAPKYFYDAAGSALFERICALPEYYPTRTELRILAERAPEISRQMGADAQVIEFGAGSLTKVRLLLDAFSAADAPKRYLPIDISGAHLEDAARRLRADYPGLTVRPIVADYTTALIVPADMTTSGKRVGFFPGSTIGNFLPGEALAFLRLAAKLLQGGGLLVGVDLVKDTARLHAAYNDAEGVTAAFNLNLLQRINTELGGDFDLQGFAHHAFYDPVRCRIEMHLISRRTQRVHIGEETFLFNEGDTIHTENSHKFTVDGFQALAMKAGFQPGPVWTDEERLFSVHWLHAPTA